MREGHSHPHLPPCWPFSFLPGFLGRGLTPCIHVGSLFGASSLSLSQSQASTAWAQGHLLYLGLYPSPQPGSLS